MREPLRDKERLRHIMESIDLIQEHTQHITYEAFATDKILFGAIVYYTMIIGEATYKLSRAFVTQHPEVPWQDIADMRHHLVHGYYQVDSHIVWQVIQHDLATLKSNIQKLLDETDWSLWEQQKGFL